MYQTLKTVFHHISKHLVRQKYSATRCIFSLFSVSENVSKHQSTIRDNVLHAELTATLVVRETHLWADDSLRGTLDVRW